MKKSFASLHARTFCHATESPDKVKLALANLLGHIEAKESRSEGVHGNLIIILEATVNDEETIAGFLRSFREEDRRALLETLPSRIDEGCNLFVRMDKQAAYRGESVMTTGDDVVSIRIHISAFPAKRAIAQSTAKEYLSRLWSAEG